MKMSLLLITILCILCSCSESTEKYNARALPVADSIANHVQVALNYANDLQGCWVSLIRDYKYLSPLIGTPESCYNVNEGLNKYVDAASEFKNIFERMRKSNDKLYAEIKDAPEGSKEVYQMIKQLLVLYDKSEKLYTDPFGRTFPVYSEELTLIERELSDVLSKLKIEQK